MLVACDDEDDELAVWSDLLADDATDAVPDEAAGDEPPTAAVDDDDLDDDDDDDGGDEPGDDGFDDGSGLAGAGGIYALPAVQAEGPNTLSVLA